MSSSVSNIAEKNLMGTRLRKEDESHDANCPYRNHGECLCKYAAPENGKHTPGPWHRNIKPAAKYPTIFAGRNTHVVQILSLGLPQAQVEANTDLIAAAPELLEALAHIRKAIELNKADMKPGVCGYLNTIAEAAIAKATGQTL